MPEIRVQDEQGNTHIFPEGSTLEMIAKVLNVKPPTSPTQDAAAQIAANPPGVPKPKLNMQPVNPYTGAPATVYDPTDEESTPAGYHAAVARRQAQHPIVNAAGNDLLQGAGEGALSLGYLGKFLTDPIVKHFASPETMSAADEKLKTLTTPENTTQAIGKGVEQAGEMVATGGPIRGAATGIATHLPFLGRAAVPIARMAAEALNMGGNTFAHGEEGSGASAAIGAGTEGAGMILSPVARMLRNAAVAQYERALAPTTKINKALARKITPELVDRGVHGSLESIEDQAAMQASGLKPQLDQTYAGVSASATQGSGQKIVNDLENLKGRYVVNGKPANPAAVNAISGVQDIVKQYGDDISPNSLRKLKGIFDDPVAAKGGYAGADLTTQYAARAQKAAANSIRDILHQASPDIAKLDKEVSFWLNVQKVAGSSELRRAGQEGGLLKTLVPLGVGNAVGAAMHMAGGNPVHTLESATAAYITAHAVSAMRSPTWRTASAVLKDGFADALASGNVHKVMQLSAKFGVGVGSAQKPAK